MPAFFILKIMFHSLFRNVLAYCLLLSVFLSSCRYCMTCDCLDTDGAEYRVQECQTGLIHARDRIEDAKREREVAERCSCNID